MSAALAPLAPLAPLEGKYEIVAKIKEGGMGAIYKVRHRLLEEIRVVKVLRREFEDDADLNERFIHEARSAIRLRHPNVVQIFDFLLEGDMGYIVMEYIDGVDLSELIQRRHRPSLPLFLEVAGQSLRALGYLHQKGFVHRDISPDNLMLCSDFAGNPLVKMIDLGIAKKVEGGVNLTASGMFLGKFRYSSPEHFGSQGAGGIEPRSDLYSLGVVLYEFLTGRYPIRGEETSQLIAGHLFHPPLDFDESDPEGRVPKALREMVMRALDKDPEKRFPSAAGLTKVLKTLQAQFPLTPEAVEEANAVRELRAAEQRVDPGSTQDRLDQGFVHPTPAPPKDLPTVATPAPVAGSERVAREQIEALLAGAEALVRLNQPEEARGQLLSILRLDPENQRAHGLLSELEDGAHDATIPWGETQPSPPPSSPPSPPPLPSPEPSREERLFDHHLHAACALADEGNYADAVPHFEAALEVRPENTAVRHLLAEAQGHLDEERRAGRERLLGEVEQLRGLLASGDLDQTRERLLSARRAYGDEEVLLEVQKEIEQEERSREHGQIASTLDETAGLREDGELTRAVQTLEGARAAWEKSSLRETDEGRDVLARFDREEAALEEAHRLAAELDEALHHIKKSIERGRLVKADRLLFQAIETFGSVAALKELREELDKLHHLGHKEQLRSLIDGAGRLAEDGEFEEARQMLEKARVMAPAKPEIQAEIEKRKKAFDKARKRSRARQVEQVRGEVEGLIGDRNLEQAQARVAAAEAGLGTLQPEEAEIFETFRRRIAEGFQERVNALIHEAGVALEARRYRAALPFLEQALDLAPDDEWIADRLEQARAALARPADPSAAADVIEGLVEAGKIEEAAARLREAVEQWGETPEFDGLELQLEAGRLAERNEQSRVLAERAEEAYQADDVEKARQLASEAVELSPMNAEARTLLELLDKARAR